MTNKSVRERNNWLIYTHYSRDEDEECMKLINEQLLATGGLCEYPLYVKGLLRRKEGKIEESLQLFQAALCLNPKNLVNVKQVGKSLMLLGKYKAALDVFSAALKKDTKDVDIMYHKGLCYASLNSPLEAIDCFEKVAALSPHEKSYIELASMWIASNEYGKAIEVLLTALEYRSNSTELLTKLGLLFLQLGDSERAFEYLDKCIKQDSEHARAIFASGSVLAEYGDYESAILKFRRVAVDNSTSGELWNNIGLSFLGRKRHVAAIACLKRAETLLPFEWTVAFNLGLAHLHAKQYASAFHYFNNASKTKPDYSPVFMYLGITLSRLEDIPNATLAYERALSLERAAFEGKALPNTLLNYSISLILAGQKDRATSLLQEFDKYLVDTPIGKQDPELLVHRQQLEQYGFLLPPPPEKDDVDTEKSFSLDNEDVQLVPRISKKALSKSSGTLSAPSE